jgi:hypothetical protein
MACELDWVILRPSVVVGPAAYGGSALFRGLAAVPLLPVMPNTGLLQVVQLDDVVNTVLFFLAPGARARLVLDLAGPERLSFAEVVREYRRWLGWGEPRLLRLPTSVASGLYKLGDFAGVLGWRPPLRSTARREIVRGAVGDPREWTRVTGITPQSLSTALAAEPPSVQERWFAALYLLKPVVFTVFSAFWIVTGLLSIGPGYQIGVALMSEGGAGSMSPFAVIAGGLVDLAIGVGIAIRRGARFALYAALAVSVFYAIASTAILPRLWIDNRLLLASGCLDADAHAGLGGSRGEQAPAAPAGLSPSVLDVVRVRLSRLCGSPGHPVVDDYAAGLPLLSIANPLAHSVRGRLQIVICRSRHHLARRVNEIGARSLCRRRALSSVPMLVSWPQLNTSPCEL